MAKNSHMDEVEEVFKKFDANGDGKISVSKLRSILKALGTEASQADLERTMAEIDTDGNGFIDLKELAEFHIKGSDVDGKRLRNAFDLYDRDKNRLISASEIYVVLNRLGENYTLKDCSWMISTIDVDGDGNINFEEFKKMVTRAP